MWVKLKFHYKQYIKYIQQYQKDYQTPTNHFNSFTNAAQKMAQEGMQGVYDDYNNADKERQNKFDDESYFNRKEQMNKQNNQKKDEKINNPVSTETQNNKQKQNKHDDVSTLDSAKPIKSEIQNKEEVSMLLQKVDLLKTQLVKQETKCQDLKDEKEDLKDMLKQYNSQVKDLKSINQNLQSQIVDDKKVIEQHEHKISALLQQKSELLIEIEQLHKNQLKQNESFLNNDVQQLQRLQQNEIKDYIIKNKTQITFQQIVEGDTFLNQYEFINEQIVGSGAFGIVFKALDKQNQRIVAIKMQLVQEKENVISCIGEAQKSKLIKHKNVIKTFDTLFDCQNNTFYTISEFCDNGNLQDYCKNNVLTEQEIAQIFKSFLLGLKAIHEKKIIHGDLKPSNILVFSDKTVKVCDFGFSIQLNKLQSYISNNSGTLVYMSPEQIDKGQIRIESDYFSAGLILCFMCGLEFESEFGIWSGMKNNTFPSIQNQKFPQLLQIAYSLMDKDYKNRKTIDQIISQL